MSTRWMYEKKHYRYNFISTKRNKINKTALALAYIQLVTATMEISR